MTTDTVLPRLVTPAGEVIALELEAVSLEVASERLPFVIELSRAVARLRGFYEEIVAADMRSRGATERRVEGRIFELRADAEWKVDDAGALFSTLVRGFEEGEISRDELNKGAQQLITYKWDHRVLNVIAKRLPEINQHRRRVDGDARLRMRP